MAPNISVPMNFGVRLLESPTHNTLELKTSEGAVLRASSVILSFNSPVIDHMTTTLHLTSVDMEEFSKEAVRYFVDAAYSGETPTIAKSIFREVNKIANVFKMTWLAERCIEQFTQIANAIEVPSFEDLFFLFEEASFAATSLKSSQLASIALGKIRSLEGGQEFIKRYLVDISSLSCHQLDLILELAGPAAHHIVQPLTEKLAVQLSQQEATVPFNYKYLIDNSDLSLCPAETYEEFFDILERVSQSQEDLRWTLKLYRSSTKKTLAAVRSFNQHPTSSSNLSLQDYSSCVPNLFCSLNDSLTFEQTVNWLGKSEKVSSLLMFFEGLWTWMWDDMNVTMIQCTAKFLNSVKEIKRKRNWHGTHKDFLSFERLSLNSQLFFENIKKCEELCPVVGESSPWLNCASIDLKDENFRSVKDDYIESIFTPGTRLQFYFKHPAISECSRPGQCGFILKTVASNEGTKMVLCTDSRHYSESIHYHNELKAKNLHMAVCYWDDVDDEYVALPISWCGRPVSSYGKLDWSLLSPREKTHSPHDYFLSIVFTDIY